ncbi:MAG: hypothetical protein KTR32_22720 [Granulosicoccus sp.]|nr:hypothetical protein [Granulosicoccus sp.]
MPERVSALADHYKCGRYGSPGTPGVVIELVPDLLLWQLTAWPTTVKLVEKNALQLIGVPSGFDSARRPANHVAAGPRGVLLRVEPLKWWLLDVTPAALAPETGTTLDLSHSRTRLRITGESAATLLNRFVSLDLRSTGRDSDQSSGGVEKRSGMAEDRIMSTSIHHVTVSIWQRSAGFELFLPRSFAVSILELLCQGAEQFGYELR